MHQHLRDTFGLGLTFWLIGYLLSLVLYFILPPGVMGWILFVVLTPVMIGVTWRWFRDRNLPVTYYLKVALTWTAIAVVGDYLFIVHLFSSQGYYQADVLVYYLVTFLIPVGVGIGLKQKGKETQTTR
jgi:putative effector of murein hydrolase LrgA (UPF0299 family)